MPDADRIAIERLAATILRQEQPYRHWARITQHERNGYRNTANNLLNEEFHPAVGAVDIPPLAAQPRAIPTPYPTATAVPSTTTTRRRRRPPAIPE